VTVRTPALVRRSEAHGAPDLEQLALDADRSPQEVDVLEREADKLAPPETNVAGCEDVGPVEHRMGVGEGRELLRLEESHRPGHLSGSFTPRTGFRTSRGGVSSTAAPRIVPRMIACRRTALGESVPAAVSSATIARTSAAVIRETTRRGR